MEYGCVDYTRYICGYDINVIEWYDILSEVDNHGDDSGDGKGYDMDDDIANKLICDDINAGLFPN